MSAVESQIWYEVNHALIAKSIGELSYEQIISPVYDLTNETYTLKLSSGVRYQFKGWKSIWDHLRIDSKSVVRRTSDCSETKINAGQFFIDAQSELALTDIILANFLEEMHQTLFADMTLLKKNKHLKAKDIALMSGLQVQTILNGHPKILLNKGRLGWGANDLQTYSPEQAKPFQLIWIAVKKENSVSGLSSVTNYEAVLQSGLSQTDVESMKAILNKNDLKDSDYLYMPIHPWQWDRLICLQYAGELANNCIVHLGTFGDLYQPQISLRTLTNVTNPKNDDIKLPLSILNTSAVRGIPERYIASSPAVATALATICERDTLLKTAETEVLQEKFGISYKHPLFSQVDKAPYRYHETLGAIWRQSSESKLKDNELAVITGSLFHQDQDNQSLIGAYIQKSGLTISQWLTKYFEVVVIPLYHLQVKYGLGLVAHGQNITLKLRNFIPSGILLKDFQGDLRISKSSAASTAATDHAELIAVLSKNLDSLPPEYLIHDLVTGHFVTVLRFISEVLQESDSYSEKDFYRLLATTIENYLQTNETGQNHAQFEHVNLLKEKLHRVLLNKVRFKIGYADSAERPLPQLGTDLLNPLYFAKKQTGEQI